MIFQPGHVYSIHCSYISPPHRKFSISIYPPEARFFWINTEPRNIKSDAQLLIKLQELPCLRYDSYINTGEIFTFPPYDLNTSKHVGTLTPITIKNIKSIINEHPYLTGNQIKMIMENLKE